MRKAPRKFLQMSDLSLPPSSLLLTIAILLQCNYLEYDKVARQCIGYYIEDLAGDLEHISYSVNASYYSALVTPYLSQVGLAEKQGQERVFPKTWYKFSGNPWGDKPPSGAQAELRFLQQNFF